MALLEGKRALITGLASNRSIAWGIAKAMQREGAEIALTYQNEKLKPRVEKFAAELGSNLAFPCDVGDDRAIDELFRTLATHWDVLDIVVHSIAYAPREELEGLYLDAVTREGFMIAHEISSYSFTALARGARELMRGRNGALLTLTYIGSLRSMPGYNVMGLAKASLEASVRFLAVSMGKEGHRVNAISAGPIKTLAASGVKNFRRMLSYNATRSPLGRNISTEEVGNAATFLASDLASGITGETLYVDAGFNITAMGTLEEEPS